MSNVELRTCSKALNLCQSQIAGYLSNLLQFSILFLMCAFLACHLCGPVNYYNYSIHTVSGAQPGRYVIVEADRQLYSSIIMKYRRFLSTPDT